MNGGQLPSSSVWRAQAQEQEAASESADSGQPIRARGALNTARLTSSLSVTLLTSAGPHDGKYEEPGATLTPPQPLSLASFACPPQPLVANPAVWPQGLQTHAASLQRPATWLFYCLADAKKCHTEKQCTHTFLARSWSCVTCVHFPLVCPVLGEGGSAASFQEPWIVNGFQINWQDLQGSEIIRRHCNEVGLPWPLMWLGFGHYYYLFEQKQHQ